MDITDAQLKETIAMQISRVKWSRLLAWGFLILWIFITLFPIYWTARMAFSTQKMLLAHPTSLTPAQFTTDAFKRVLGRLPLQTVLNQGGSPKVMHFALYLRTTFLITLIVSASSTFFNATAAYAFSRLRFPLRNKIFYMFLIVQIMPSVLGLIPNFILIQSLGWIGTLQGIIAPAFFGSAFGVFFLRQFFLGINRELEEAAMLDGASLFGVFWRIVIPMSVPALTTMFLLSYMGAWNELQWAYFAGGSGRIEKTTTLTVALTAFRAQSQRGLPDYTGLMAGTLISIVPVLILFLVFGRKLVDSIKFQGYR